MQSTREVSTLRWEQGTFLSTQDLVVTECPLAIKVNGYRTIDLLCSPQDLESLIVGFLLGEGIIAGWNDIDSMLVNADESIAEVWLRDRNAVPRQPGERARSSGCGLGAIYLDVVTNCRPNASTKQFPAEAILALSQRFNKMSELFLSTGGVHSAALCSDAEVIVFHEDIGRHNAVDKVIGSAARQGVDLADKFLLCSGRISSEMLVKAAKCNIPVVVSRSAPTSLAVELAERLNITLIGFARGARMNIYCHPVRVVKA